jgi:RHS repeat-associated protein
VDGSNGITYASDFETPPTGCLAGAACYTPQGSFYALSIGQTSSFTGLNLSHSYNNRLQPLEFKASSTGGYAMDITYSFVDAGSGKNSGHVASISNNLNSNRSQLFTYDQVNRIISAGTIATTGTYCWGYLFSYDPWGNLLSQSGWTPNYSSCTNGLVMGSVSADGNNHISAFTYDAAGNTQNDGTFAYTWDAESQMKTAAGVTHGYDGDGRHVSKSSGKLYWYGAGDEILAETTGAGVTTAEYIFFGGKRIAMLPAGGSAQYYVEDFLGTSRIVAQNNGVVCYDGDFTPFGGELPWTNTCPAQNNYKFEGKERDTVTSNDDFGARSYSWRFGRWLSADWSAVPVPVPYANLTNPQTLNLYSMVADDPESFADLDGHTQAAQNGPSCATPNTCGAKSPGSIPSEQTKKDEEAQAAAQKQPNNTTGYQTQKEAARAALANINPKSIKENKEYAGRIYKDESGLYHYSKPVGGTDQTSQPSNSPVPEASTVVGDYHTHGDYSIEGSKHQAIRTSDPKRDSFRSNFFSPQDKQVSSHRANGSSTYQSYLGTPSGKFYWYNSSTDKQGVLR